MNVTREVILDLLPVYLAGEASPATRALIDAWLAQDPELAKQVREQSTSVLPRPSQSLAPELELRSLVRTRRMLWSLRWTCALAVMFTALAFALRIDFLDGRLVAMRFMLMDYPLQFGVCLVLAAVGWIAYFALRRRLRSTF